MLNITEKYTVIKTLIALHSFKQSIYYNVRSIKLEWIEVAAVERKVIKSRK